MALLAAHCALTTPVLSADPRPPSGTSDNATVAPCMIEFLRRNLLGGWLTNRARFARIEGNYQVNSLYRLPNFRPQLLAFAQETGARELRKMGFPAPESVFEYPISPELYRTRTRWDRRYAITHPDIQELLKIIDDYGYKLVVAPGLNASKYGVRVGHSNSGDRTLRILPHADLAILRHEMQHMINDRIGIGWYLTGSALRPPSSPEEQALITRWFQLRDTGFDREAADETLAISAEIQQLRGMGYTPWSGVVYNARKYAWNHQIRSLTARIEANTATAEQLKLLRRIKRKRALLHPALLQIAAGTAGISGAVAYYFFNESLGRLFVLGSNGESAIFSLDPEASAPETEAVPQTG